jgi:DNA invertase Pin-like site-specific DNA recombinase
MSTIRAGFYYRKSTDRQEDSIDRQRAAVLLYATRQGFEPAGEPYVDEGIAGDVFDKRPGFQRLLRDAAAGKFDMIVVDEPSRLSRQNPIDLIEKVIAPLRRAKVRLDTASKGPLDYESLPGLIMMTVHACKAEEESHDLSRRMIGGIAKRAKNGTWFGWAPPYGLRVVREFDDKGKVISRKCVFGPEEEVRAVRFIFDAVANRGWPLRRVCRELEARHVKPPNGGHVRNINKAEGRWNASSVRKILLNRKYIGDQVWNETHIGKYYGWRGGQNGEAVKDVATNSSQHRSRNADGDIIVIAAPDLIPAIIDRDTFARASAALARAKKCTRPGGTASYLFTHMLVCGDCGSYMRGQPDHGHKGYICAKYKEYGSEACSRNTVSEKVVKEAILGAVLNDILDPNRLDEIEAEIKRRLRDEVKSGEADRLRRQINAVGVKIARGNENLALLPADRLSGVIAQLRQWEANRSQLEERLTELDSGGAQAQAILDEARKQLWRLRESLQGDDEEAQATVIREVLSKAEVRFSHERTHGGRSPTGHGRLLNRPCGLLLYVRPGLGLSHLCISDWMRRARAGASGRASNCRPACRCPGCLCATHRGNRDVATGRPGRRGPWRDRESSAG